MSEEGRAIFHEMIVPGKKWGTDMKRKSIIQLYAPAALGVHAPSSLQDYKTVAKNSKLLYYDKDNLLISSAHLLC